MATATSRRYERRARRARGPAALTVVLLAVAVPLLVSAIHRAPPATRAGAFAWLRSGPVPAGWHVGRTATGAELPFPPGWRSITSDRGSVSAAPATPAGAFAGYLNATPRSGAETLANWRRFRVTHVAAEGGRRVRLSAAASGLRFRGGRGSCVIDSYSTSRARFREVACIVAGSRATTVVVAAAPVARWGAELPLLERAVAGFGA